MKATVTLKIKLEATEQASQSLSQTRKAYVIALNHTSEVAFEKQVFNSVALHHITYRDVRELTKLPANLACSARNVVAEAYKRDKEKRHRWKDKAAMRYDARTLTVKLDQQYATLTTLDGRVRVNLILSDYNCRRRPQRHSDKNQGREEAAPDSPRMAFLLALPEDRAHRKQTRRQG